MRAWTCEDEPSHRLIDKIQCPTQMAKKISYSSVLCDDLAGWDGGGWEGGSRGRGYMYT